MSRGTPWDAYGSLTLIREVVENRIRAGSSRVSYSVSREFVVKDPMDFRGQWEQSCDLGTSKMESPQAIPHGEGERE
jgi:hypothetical protein